MDVEGIIWLYNNSAAIGKSINDALNILHANGEISSNISEACHNADIYIDFTLPKVTINALPEIAKTNVKGLIIGTAGFDDEQNQIFNDSTNRFAIVKTGNFSLGVNLVSIVVEITAKTLPKDWEIEIVEAHHKRKIDAPSGTALLLGDAAALGRGENLNALKLALRDGITEFGITEAEPAFIGNVATAAEAIAGRKSSGIELVIYAAWYQ